MTLTIAKAPIDALLLALSICALSISGAVAYERYNYRLTGMSEPWRGPRPNREALLFGSALSRDTILLFVDLTDSGSRHLLTGLDVAYRESRLKPDVYLYHLPNDRLHRATFVSMVAECSRDRISLISFARMIDGLFAISSRAYDDWLATRFADESMSACTKTIRIRAAVQRGWQVADEGGITSAPAIVASGYLYRKPKDCFWYCLA